MRAVLILFIILFACFDDHKVVAQFEKSFMDWGDLTVDHANDTSSGGLDITNNQNNPCRVLVVDPSGAGDSETVQGAVDLVPEDNILRYKIYILPGIYREKVHVPKSKPYISFIGGENKASETVITWHDKASDKNKNGCPIGTFESASVTVDSDYFGAREVTFENSVVAKPGTDDMQAVALRLKSDKAWLYRVRILGTQDTLLDESGLHYFKDCYIQGTVDFIFGNAKSFYQDCVLHSIAQEYGAIAANHRDTPDQDTGFSFFRCHVTGSGRVLLGRAWGNYSRVVYSSCDFNVTVCPEGWSDWRNAAKDRTVEFAEYNCTGRGADRRSRVSWSKSLNFLQAWPFLTTQFVQGYTWLSLL